MDAPKQIDLLTKTYFIIKTQKDDDLIKLNLLKKENDDLKNLNSELQNMLKHEKSKSNYEVMCEMENIKLQISEEKSQLEKLKDELKIKDERLSLKKQGYLNTIEENGILIKNLEKTIEDLQEEMKEMNSKHNEKIKELQAGKDEIESLNRILISRNEEFKNRYEILSLNYNELIEVNKKLEEKWKSEMNINFTTGNDGVALDGISINEDKENSIIDNKPEKVTCHMKIDSKKLSCIYSSQSKKNVLGFLSENYNTNCLFRQSDVDFKTVTENIPDGYQVNTIDESSYISVVTDKNFDTHSQRGSIGNIGVVNDQSFLSINENSINNYKEAYKGVDSSFYNSVNHQSNTKY